MIFFCYYHFSLFISLMKIPLTRMAVVTSFSEQALLVLLIASLLWLFRHPFLRPYLGKGARQGEIIYRPARKQPPELIPTVGT